ncbi:hypothetical protein CEXT_560001 [Caerostris extrusa]|uniref:Ribosomal protein S3 n=1 Tax=Caerostris extrusa TaxID=172846 RepID=A0AAV4RUM1_CAEEX|nr:hypothetical protein CEXT_560001 [Caerostris extrusa]
MGMKICYNNLQSVATTGTPSGLVNGGFSLYSSSAMNGNSSLSIAIPEQEFLDFYTREFFVPNYGDTKSSNRGLSKPSTMVVGEIRDRNKVPTLPQFESSSSRRRKRCGRHSRALPDMLRVRLTGIRDKLEVGFRGINLLRERVNVYLEIAHARKSTMQEWGRVGFGVGEIRDRNKVPTIPQFESSSSRRRKRCGRHSRALPDMLRVRLTGIRDTLGVGFRGINLLRERVDVYLEIAHGRKSAKRSLL